MELTILSLFPEYFQGPLQVSMLKRAVEKGLLQINLVNIRDFAEGQHAQVDERPFGGGPGMLMMAGPIVKAIRSQRKKASRVIYLTPQGKLLTAQKCKELAKEEHLILLCGHYEGVDQRALDLEVDEEISIGDYVLTSGMPAALVVLDAIGRRVPGVVGHPEGVLQDSFEDDNVFEGPQYTRPRVFEGKEAPPVLLEGHHKKIKKWRKEKGLTKAKKIRPDLAEKL
ncbi:MAG: tRNA (guanosine(37)-N1)-methyltransferase TrmD [Candidatus Algichlamydia australiensis]|nr:tRNA (guanosine(37)-N1)-methyltransferase TrmD [Chlamydiales bacterium]